MTSPFNKSNSFDLTHEVYSTYEMGPLYPNCLMEVVPGDTFDMNSEAFSRFEAMISPEMSRIDKLQYWFYVPNRILFDDWEKYITGGFDGNDTTVKPYMVSPSGGYAVGSLADHLGIPTGVANLRHSALPFRAYEKIMNDWFLDENVDTMFTETKTAGLDTTTNTSLVNKRWEKDYFTNSMPTAQRGLPSSIPLLGSCPVVGDGTTLGMTDGTNNFGLTTWSNPDRQLVDISTSYGQPVGTARDNSGSSVYDKTLGVVTDKTKSGLKALLSDASPVTINQLRVAFQVQKFMEKNMRGGARLVEWTLSHFGVRVPDGRLQRSEFLGAKRQPIMISAVEQNSSTDAVSPQGNLAGRGVESVNVSRFRKSFVEQGWVIGLVCYVPRTLYSQGLHRMWSRETRYDEYLPVFAHLGEQEVKKKELVAQGSSVVDSDGNIVDELTWAYQDRYNEFRHIPSTIHGQFRTSLKHWTLARDFDVANNGFPELSSTFVTANPSTRIFAVQTPGVDHITAQFLHHVRAIRPLPKFGAPGLIDHD